MDASRQSEQAGLIWPSLFEGRESQESIDLRQKKFQQLWALHQTEIDFVVNQVDETLVDSVLDFVRSKDEKKILGRLRTGLIVSGTTRNTQRDLFQGWKTRQSGDTQEIFIELHPSKCPNLQVTLKNVIRMAISQHGGSQEYTTFLAKQKALIPMNFDLELLQRYVEQHQISRVLLSVTDVETFDTGILSELIAMASAWLGRIPFQLLINIATTVELFESRISRSVAASLDAKVFQSADDNADPLYRIYSAVQHNSETDVFLGPPVLKVLTELAEDQSTTTATFTRAIKYAFMTHFFANPLSTLDSKSNSDLSGDKLLCQAIRNTPGFQGRCEQLAKGDKTHLHQARELIRSDDTLLTDTIEVLQANRTRLRSSLEAVQLLHMIYELLELTPMSPLALELQLITSLPHLRESDVYLDIESALIDLRPEQFANFLKTFMILATKTQFTESSNEVATGGKGAVSEEFLGKIRDIGTSGTAEEGPQHQFTRFLTSYIELKVLDKPDNDSSSTPSLATTSPFHAYLSEATVLSTRSPMNAVLHARPRYALERALTRPADYLGCECCMANKHGEISDRTTLPATSLLLTLLNEAGNIVNVRDLWDAFRETIASTNAPETDEEEDVAAEKPDEDRLYLALFYGALADLRHLGFLRSSKRKPGVECIAKTAWMGL